MKNSKDIYIVFPINNFVVVFVEADSYRKIFLHDTKIKYNSVFNVTYRKSIKIPIPELIQQDINNLTKYNKFETSTMIEFCTSIYRPTLISNIQEIWKYLEEIFKNQIRYVSDNILSIAHDILIKEEKKRSDIKVGDILTILDHEYSYQHNSIYRIVKGIVNNITYKYSNTYNGIEKVSLHCPIRFTVSTERIEYSTFRMPQMYPIKNIITLQNYKEKIEEIIKNNEENMKKARKAIQHIKENICV